MILSENMLFIIIFTSFFAKDLWVDQCFNRLCEKNGGNSICKRAGPEFSKLFIKKLHNNKASTYEKST